MSKKYTFLLLDCDGTLMDFEKAEAQALEKLFQELGLVFKPEYRPLYHKINDACWKALERGEMTKEQLQKQRFRTFGEAICADFPAERAGERYIELLGEGSFLLPGALQVCQRLSQTHKLYLVTNGVEKTQIKRLSRSEIKEYILEMFVSEAVGIAKPDPRYFQYVFEHIPGFRPEEALMVGDSLSSDIRGGLNAGIDTCWVNPSGQMRPEGWDITYEIRDITELPGILGEEK